MAAGIAPGVCVLLETEDPRCGGGSGFRWGKARYSPMNDAQSGDKIGGERPEGSIRDRRLKALLVEDFETMRNAVRRILESININKFAANHIILIVKKTST